MKSHSVTRSIQLFYWEILRLLRRTMYVVAQAPGYSLVAQRSSYIWCTQTDCWRWANTIVLVRRGKRFQRAGFFFFLIQYGPEGSALYLPFSSSAARLCTCSTSHIVSFPVAACVCSGNSPWELFDRTRTSLPSRLSDGDWATVCRLTAIR